MDCLKFQDSLSDYVEGELDSRSRAECAGHRLVCRDCRELYTDVRSTIQALGATAFEDPGPLDSLPLDGLNARILAATTAGEMLSCNEFDRLIERYFDGVLLAPTFQTFQAHFEKCSKCRRLMGGIEEAIEICREIKDAEVDAPSSLQDRILAATVGPRKTSWFEHSRDSVVSLLFNAARMMRTPQMVAALLIFAASSLLILSRFGSVGGLALHATNTAELFVNEGQEKMITTRDLARSFLFSEAAASTAKNPVEPQPSPSPQSAVMDSGKQLEAPASHERQRRHSQHQK